MRKHILTLLILITGACTSAQQLYFNHLSVNSGLSQGVNNCIYRDSKGFVWISSFDGLNRFDGINCSSFRSSIKDTGGLKGTLFLNILEDKEANLWIGSNEGLNFYNRKLDRFFSYHIQNRKDAEQFYSPFYIDDQNRVWLQSSADLFIFDLTGKKFTQVSSSFAAGNLILKTLPQDLYKPLSKILAVNNNLPVLWTGDVSNNSVTWKKQPLQLENGRINTFLLSDKDTLWLGTNKGLQRYSLRAKNGILSPAYNTQQYNISAIHADNTGALWLGTLQSGLLKTDAAQLKVEQQYLSSPYNSYSLSGNQIQYIYTDAYSNLWVSVWGKGIDYTSLNKFRFNHFVTKEQAVLSGTDNFIKSIVEVNDETWCGTQNDGILILDTDKKIKKTIREGLPASIEYLYAGTDNQILAATFNGLYQIDKTGRNIKKLFADAPYTPASQQFNYISALKNKDVLLSSNAGLFISEKTKGGYSLAAAKGVAAKDVYLTTYSDELEQIYISKAFKGFAVYKRNADSFALVKEFPVQATIKCFSETEDSIIWIGSTIGLIQFNKHQLKIERIFTTADGLSNQYIYGIIQDNDFLWISTNAGINRFHKKEYAVKTFSEGDGLQSNEYNTYSFYKNGNGELLFGGVNGLNAFSPENLTGTTFPPQLILTALQLNDTAYNPGINYAVLPSLSVKYNQNTISFQFTVIDYANAGAATISYMLEGYDKGWVTAPNKSFIRYANLPADNYQLKVKAFNAEGMMAKEIYSLSVTVETPWWQSFAFRLAVILLLTGVAVLFIRSYINRKLEKQKAAFEKRQAVEEERNRISRDMHDDLGSGLTKIAILSEVVKKHVLEPEKVKVEMDKIGVSSRELVDNLQDIIWVLNPKNDTLESLSAYIREYGLKYFEPFGTTITFDYPDEFSVLKLGEEQRRNIFLTIKESFNNISKHAWCNHVNVIIKEKPQQIMITIADDGKGFDMNTVRTFSNGLTNMQHRIKNSGGTYQINSTPGKGTITEIKINC